MESKSTKVQEMLNDLMKRYMARVPDVSGIISAMIQEGIIQHASEIENDHIAFRTLGVPNLGVASLEKIFLYYGYTKRDYYFFKEKKLNAWWYSPPVAGLPRIFISELRVDDLSSVSQAILHSSTDSMLADPVESLDMRDPKAVDFYFHSSSWTIPSLEDYESLADESEYAAWAIYNRYYLNHFTMSVHNLKKGDNTLATYNALLERNAFKL